MTTSARLAIMFFAALLSACAATQVEPLVSPPPVTEAAAQPVAAPVPAKNPELAAFFEALRADELMAVTRSRIEHAQQGITAAERRLAVGSATRGPPLSRQVSDRPRSGLRRTSQSMLTVPSSPDQAP